jgi:hypothetical protein
MTGNGGRENLTLWGQSCRKCRRCRWQPPEENQYVREEDESGGVKLFRAMKKTSMGAVLEPPGMGA